MPSARSPHLAPDSSAFYLSPSQSGFNKAKSDRVYLNVELARLFGQGPGDSEDSGFARSVVRLSRVPVVELVFDLARGSPDSLPFPALPFHRRTIAPEV